MVGGRGVERYMEPHSLTIPPPSGFHGQLIQLMPELMQGAAHRSAANFGEPSSREPVGGLRLRLSQSDEVPNHIMVDDERSIGEMLLVTLGTQVKQISPAQVRSLMASGFDLDRLTTLMSLNTEDIDMKIRIKPGSTQPRTMGEQKQDLFSLAQLQAVSPAEVRTQMAVSLNQPITKEDAVAKDMAIRVARAVIAGLEWGGRTGIPHDIMLAVFRLFASSIRIQEGDPAVRVRLERAIAAQTQAKIQDQTAAMGPQEIAQLDRGTPSLSSQASGAINGEASVLQ